MTPTDALETLKRLAELQEQFRSEPKPSSVYASRVVAWADAVDSTNFAELAEAVGNMRGVILRCLTGVVDMTGHEGIDVPNLQEAMSHVEDADRFVSGKFSDMTCRAYQAEDQLAAANAEIARLRERVEELEARNKKPDGNQPSGDAPKPVEPGSASVA